MLINIVYCDMNKPFNLSKSSFMRGVQCMKSLYLYKYHYDLQDEITESQQAIFDQGREVGTLAQQLFPGGVDASRGEPWKVSQAISYTQKLIRDGCDVIFEAAFTNKSPKGDLLCYIDILVREEVGWAAYEVKASTSVKGYHLTDTAFQHYVITGSGLPLKRTSLIHLNNQYVRNGNLDIQELFTIEDLTDEILLMQQDIPDTSLSLLEMLAAGVAPEIAMGNQCHKPFDCDFLDYCTQHSLVNEDDPDYGEAKRDQEALDCFLEDLRYPLYFLDFETIQFAIPRYDESRPHQQIPFQYSLHVLENGEMVKSQNGKIIHHAFLGTPPNDPRPEFIESLLSQLGSAGSIIVWNQTFEKTRLKEIAQDFPEYASRIEPLLDRIVDLMVPFRKKHLYLPEMKGSYALKVVLPTLVPDLSYSGLEIQEGGAASLAYEGLYFDHDHQSIKKTREELLEYCKLDTLAMVKLLEVLMRNEE